MLIHIFLQDNPLDCNECTEEDKISLGCETVAKNIIDIGDGNVYTRCPMLEIREDNLILMFLYYKNMLNYVKINMEEYNNKIPYLFFIIDSFFNINTRKILEKRNKKNV